MDGKFILRIEDTDQDRVVPGAIQAIERELDWLGMTPDEGPSQGGITGPYIQSQRKHIYAEYADQILSTGCAYRCFCSPTRLELIRKEALRNREIPKYDNRCRHLTDKDVQDKLSHKEPFTIRLKLRQGDLTFNDLVSGEVTMNLSKVEGDPIILKSDGFPTYHFANVVDDHLMKISHVLRGVEWLNSTPKHLMLFDAFGWIPPRYGHLPLILNSDGTKLSKRSDDIRLETLRSRGFMPSTILNFLAKISGVSREVFDDPFETKTIENITSPLSLEDMTRLFDPKAVNSSSNRFDYELLKQMNRNGILYLILNNKPFIIEQVKSLIRQELKVDPPDNQLIEKVLSWTTTDKRIHFFNQLVTDHAWIWREPELNFDLEKYCSSLGDLSSFLDSLIGLLENSDCDITQLKTFSAEKGFKYATVMHFVRSSLTNSKDGPPISEILILLGKERFIDYLKRAKNYITDR